MYKRCRIGSSGQFGSQMRRFVAVFITVAMLMSVVVYGFDGSYFSEDYEPQELLEVELSDVTVDFLGDISTPKENVIRIPGDVTELSGRALTERNTLMGTLDTPIGMQGFEGDYAINSPDEIVEIIVQFVTPPAVALRLMQERGLSVGRSLPGASYEVQALSAHDAFNQQLGQIPMPRGGTGVEILSLNYRLFNGVRMRVPGNMIESIAGLAEVFAIYPNVEISTMYGNMTATQSDFLKNPDFLREAREFFDTNYIHNELGFTGEGISVAVIDTGIYYNHPEFARFLDNEGRIPGWHFGLGNGPIDHLMASHGTVVSGAIVAIAPNIELWHYRDRGGGGVGATSAIEAAHEDGANIINISLGAVNFFAPFAPLDIPINLAVLDGVVVVASAGNEGMRGSYTITSPGTAALAITVGNGTEGGRFTGQFGDDISNGSSRGPVEQTYHLKPDVIAPGTGIYTTTLNSGYTLASGTSLAAPIIAGVASLLMEAFPDASPCEIKARIMNTARPLRDVNSNDPLITGAGFVRPIEALRNETIVTTRHDIPFNFSDGYLAMSSLSYGAIDARFDESMNKTLPIHIENRGIITRTYTISYDFMSNPGYAANISLSHTSVSILAGDEVIIDATMTIESTAPRGFYQGFIFVSDGEMIVARLPFAAVAMETQPLSAEMALREAVRNAGSEPIVIELSEDITLIELPHALYIPPDTDITLRSVGEEMHTLSAGGNFDAIRIIGQSTRFTLENVAITRIEGTFGRGIINQGNFTMLGGIVSNHSLQSGQGAGVLNMQTFYMLGGTIRDNISISSGGGVGNQGVFIMKNGEISDNQGANGGGVQNSLGNFSMKGGTISNNISRNSAGVLGNGGGISGRINVIGGEISGNIAATGGGIWVSFNDLRNGHVRIGEDAIFSDNIANSGHNRLPHDDEVYNEFIRGTQWTAPFTQGFNNFDISYVIGSLVTIRQLSFELGHQGSLLNIQPLRVIVNTPILNTPRFPNNPDIEGYVFVGWYLDAGFTAPIDENTRMPAVDTTIFARWEPQTPAVGVNSWEELRSAVNEAPANVQTTILIGSSFGAPTGEGLLSIGISIPDNRDITLVSTSTAFGDDNVRTLTQTNNGQRHFFVRGNLTIGQNITLSGGIANNTNNSGGVDVNWGTFTMSTGSVIENCRWEGVGGAVRVTGVSSHLDNGAFNLFGGTIQNNKASYGGGVFISSHHRMNMSSGSIIGNEARHDGGGIYLGGGAVTDGLGLYMTNGNIKNNVAGHNGGGIYTTTNSTAPIVPVNSYGSLYIGVSTVFYNNIAGNGASAPPDNRLAHIATEHASIWDYALNNYDIVYRGRLGQLPLGSVVNTWAQLRDAVNAVPVNVPTTIKIGSSFDAPVGINGNVIWIPEDRDITLISTNTAPTDTNVRTLIQPNNGQRHFMVFGSLTLDQNITLSGGEANNLNNSGGVTIRGGGTLTMKAGSIIENCRRMATPTGGTPGGAINFISNAANSPNFATFNMLGGTIRNNVGFGGGGVFLGLNNRMNMSGGSITGNLAMYNSGGGVLVDSGAIARGRGLYMTGGSITNNTASRDGGGIFLAPSRLSTVLPTEYNNIFIGEDVVFSGNVAGNGASAPPFNRIPQIAATPVSIWNYALNNYDIAFRGRLDQVQIGHVVNTWAQLWGVINEAPANESITIEIGSNMDITSSIFEERTGLPITIPADRCITLVSSNTSAGAANERILTQARQSHRHFIVNGNLTLGKNITLSGGLPNNANSSGGVQVNSGGTFTMVEGSIIENCRWSAAVWLNNTASRPTTFNMLGGTIRNNSAHQGGGVILNMNTRMNMSGGSITGNQATSDGGGVFVGNGAVSAGFGLYMTGGSITNNRATRNGGGIFSSNFNNNPATIPITSYNNIFIGAAAVFSGNEAGNRASAPPNNRLPHISEYATASIWNYVLNNYDINYTGRLGQVPQGLSLNIREDLIDEVVTNDEAHYYANEYEYEYNDEYIIADED